MTALGCPERRRFVSGRSGLLRSLDERRCPLDGYGVTDVVAKLRSPGADGSWASETNGGGSLRRAQSLAAALGESVERYCLSVYDARHFVRGTAASVGELGCRPEELVFFLAEQYDRAGFPFRRFTPSWDLNWVEGYSVLRGAGVHLPASLVYVPYAFAPREQALSFQGSPGTSCHRSYTAAAVRAVLEVVERDALTICWETQASFPPVATSQVTDVASRLALAQSHVALHCFDLTTDLEIPVVLTLVVCRSCEPEVSMGIAAHIDGTLALTKSIEEAISSFRSSVYLCATDRRSRSDVLAQLQTDPDFSAHALYHARRGAACDFGFLLEGVGRPRVLSAHPAATDDEGIWRALQERLLAAKQDAVLFDLSHAELRDLGYFTVRAVMPGMVRQSLGVQARHLANPRILEVPASLGIPSHLRTRAALLAHHVPSP